MVNHSPDAFFQQTHGSFQAARKTAQQNPDYYVRIGEYSIKLSFNSCDMLSMMTPALNHIRIPEIENPHLTVCCWDSLSTNTPLPYLPWSDMDFLTSKEIPYFSKDGLHVSFNKQNGSLSVFYESARTGLFWINSLSEFPFHDKAAPLRIILQWFMQKRRRYCIHSAAVSDGNTGILLAGRGRAGKSTTSLLCLLKGMDFAGDDYVLLSENSTFSVQSLYSSAKIDAKNLELLPDLAGKVSNRDRMGSEKAVFFLHDHFPGRITSGFPVSALLLPKIKRGFHSVIKEASSAEGIKALAPSTVFLQAGARQETFIFLARFVKSIPCFFLELGTDFKSIPRVIKSFMKDIYIG